MAGRCIAEISDMGVREELLDDMHYVAVTGLSDCCVVESRKNKKRKELSREPKSGSVHPRVQLIFISPDDERHQTCPPSKGECNERAEISLNTHEELGAVKKMGTGFAT